MFWLSSKCLSVVVAEQARPMLLSGESVALMSDTELWIRLVDLASGTMRDNIRIDRQEIGRKTRLVEASFHDSWCL